MRPLDPTKVVDALGRRVAELRIENGRTQQELADALEVTLRHVQAIEGGKQNMSVRALVGVANALDVPLAPLFELPTTMSRRPGRPKKS